MKVIVIGGVSAGMAAASKLRREIPDAVIEVYDKGPEVSYGACGLPYYLSGEILDLNHLRARTADEFRNKYNIRVFTEHEVTKVDADKKEIEVLDIKADRTFTSDYDKLVIATGSSSVVPPFPGVELKNVFTLKTLDDGKRMKEALDSPHVENVAIVGSGFIGLEVAEALLRLKKKVRIIEMMPQILNSYEPEISAMMEEELLRNGVQLHKEEKVLHFSGKDSVESLTTDKGTYEVDLVLLSVGVRPNTKFLDNLNLNLLPNGAILVNRKMETGIPDIYAAGDCATVYHKVLEKQVFAPMGTNASKQGRIIGENLAGKDMEFPGVLGSSVLRFMNLEVGKTGITGKEAADNGMEVETGIITASNHASYYPDPKPIKIKMVYDKKTKRVLGACLGGGSGAALRANTFAAIIDAGLTADQVAYMDLCYAPHFAPLWDPILVAAANAKD